MYSLSPGYSRFAVEKIDIVPVKLLLASSAVPQHLEHEIFLLQTIRYFCYWTMIFV
jgi:hypothetical protein